MVYMGLFCVNSARAPCKYLPDSQGHVTVPDGLTTLPHRAFAWCDDLVSITLPESLTSIEANAFDHAENLVNISIPDRVAVLNTHTFRACAKLERVKLPTSLVQVNGAAFEYNSALIALDFPDGVTNIGQHNCDACSSLEYLKLPASLTSIGVGTFTQGKFGSLVIPEGVRTIPSSFISGNTVIRDVIIPDAVTSIGSSAFRGCTNLQRVYVPDGCTVGSFAFADTAGGYVFGRAPMPDGGDSADGADGADATPPPWSPPPLSPIPPFRPPPPPPPERADGPPPPPLSCRVAYTGTYCAHLDGGSLIDRTSGLSPEECFARAQTHSPCFNGLTHIMIANGVCSCPQNNDCTTRAPSGPTTVYKCFFDGHPPIAPPPPPSLPLPNMPPTSPSPSSPLPFPSMPPFHPPPPLPLRRPPSFAHSFKAAKLEWARTPQRDEFTKMVKVGHNFEAPNVRAFTYSYIFSVAKYLH